MRDERHKRDRSVKNAQNGQQNYDSLLFPVDPFNNYAKGYQHENCDQRRNGIQQCSMKIISAHPFLEHLDERVIKVYNHRINDALEDEKHRSIFVPEKSHL
jgi:hypothetical protein